MNGCCLQILRAVKAGALTGQQIAAATGIRENHVRTYTTRLVRANRLERVRRPCETCGRRHTVFVAVEAAALVGAVA